MLLVALDKNGGPVSVSPTLKDNQNIIVWMDHRSMSETDEINRTNDHVLKYVGNQVSPEMEIPKILWLKRNMPQQYNKTAKFFDLADFLVYKATGLDTRSTCCAVCKWTYLAHEKEGKQWSSKLFEKIDLTDMFDGGRVGKTTSELGSVAGNLSAEAAAQLGLTTQCKVGVGIIDAHCGGIGILGGSKPSETLAIIGGTSSCHMAVSEKPVFVKGVWGPYYGAMLPSFWLSEGGQSAAGSLVDHVITDSSQYAQLKSEADSKKTTVYQLLNDEIY